MEASADRAGIVTGARPTGARTKHRGLAGQGQGLSARHSDAGAKKTSPISKQSELWSCHDGAASVRIPFCYKPSTETGSNIERETERILFISIR